MACVRELKYPDLSGGPRTGIMRVKCDHLGSHFGRPQKLAKKSALVGRSDKGSLDKEIERKEVSKVGGVTEENKIAREVSWC